MDFNKKSIKKRAKRSKKDVLSDSNVYNHRLQFYKTPPTDTISLFEFEDYAVERLKVLKAVETAGEKFIKGHGDYYKYVNDELRKTQFKFLLKIKERNKENESDDEEEPDADEIKLRKLDYISHFILRLAYCRSDELRRWFLQQELDLFKLRFQSERSREEKTKFLQVNNLNYQSIDKAEKADLQEKLAAASNIGASTVETMEFFKVKFTEVLDLVHKRRVYVQRGMAFVPYDELVSLLTTVYREHLSQSLSLTSRALPHLEEDGRLLPMLCGLSKRYLGSDYIVKKSNVGQITADMIEMLSKKSFPPCMQQLHSNMRQAHHLRHGGRQQYGLFLKGIGLSLEEAIKFWRSEFTKLIDVDKFDKQYSYNIRHNYGKEGKRADYTPYSCAKIIMSNAPGPGDCHGCPFKHTDADLLKQKLKSQGISDLHLDKIMSDVKTSRFNVACTRYYEAVHKLPVDSQLQSFSHPNQWFEESQRHHSGETKGLSSLGTPKTPRAPYRGSQSSQSTGTPKSQGASQSTGTPKSQGASQSTGTPKSQPLAAKTNNTLDEMDDDFDEEMAMQM